MIHSRSVAYILCCVLAVSSSFAPFNRALIPRQALDTATRRYPLHLSSSNNNNNNDDSTSKQDEIARLQEQIRRLQEEGEAATAVESSTATSKTTTGLVDPRAAELERVPGKDIMFSEGDLLDANIISSDNSGLGVLPTILLAVGALLFFVAFSQIPVGQEDFARYSVAPATQTIDLGDLNPDRKS